MPLSEHEQRLLEQMERALYAEDPKFATSLRGPARRRGGRRRLLLGVLGALVGVGLLLAGVASSLVAVGVAGFVVLLGGTLLVVTALRSAATAPTWATPQTAPSAKKSSFMERVEERWRKRQEGDQQS